MAENFSSRLKNVFFPVTKELKVSDTIITGADIALPSTLKQTPNTKRVSDGELELAYVNVPEIFNGINKIVQNIMSAENTVFSEDKKTQAFYDKFLNSIGLTGAELSWEELLGRIFKDQCIYGKSWVEKIFSKDGKHIVDLDILDAKRMDYARTATGKIVLEKNGNPIGYTQQVAPEDMDKVPQKFTVPSGVSLNNGQLYIPKMRIALLKLYTYGDGFAPLGLVEPAYKQILRKLNLEDAYSNANYRHVYPIIHAKCGDLNHHPTPDQMDKILSKIKDLNFKKEIATPYYYELNLMQAKTPEKLDTSLRYFEEAIITSLGIPSPFVTGSGEATNRSTLVIQNRMWQLALNEIIQSTSKGIERSIFRTISALEKLNDVPTIVWGDIGLEERAEKSNRIVEYVKAGILTPEDGKERISQLEGFK